MNESLNGATIELLSWIASTPRTYGETIEAWRSNCPRLAVWDDAQTAGLVRVDARGVTLTQRGRRALREIRSAEAT